MRIDVFIGLLFLLAIASFFIYAYFRRKFLKVDPRVLDRSVFINQESTKWNWHREWPLRIIEKDNTLRFWTALITSIIFFVMFASAITPLLGMRTIDLSGFSDIPLFFRLSGYLVGLSFLLSFFGVALLNLKSAVENAMQMYFYGRSRLTMQSFPVKLGSKLRCELALESKIKITKYDSITLKLACIKYYRGHRSKVSQKPIWIEEKVLQSPAMLGSEQKALQIEFDVPIDLPASGDTRKSSRYLWRIYIESNGLKLNYKQDFDIPVIRI